MELYQAPLYGKRDPAPCSASYSGTPPHEYVPATRGPANQPLDELPAAIENSEFRISSSCTLPNTAKYSVRRAATPALIAETSSPDFGDTRRRITRRLQPRPSQPDDGPHGLTSRNLSCQSGRRNVKYTIVPNVVSMKWCHHRGARRMAGTMRRGK